MALSAGLLQCPLTALDPNRAMSQYIHDHWGPEQGFPRGPVYAISQTTDGYLWIGTQAGLVRFDGWNFLTVNDPSRNFQIANVLGLAPAPDGSLWVRLQGPTLLRYRNGVFERPFNTLSDASITAITVAAHGQLFVAKGGGVVLEERNGRFAPIESGPSLSGSPILSLAQTPSGDLWLGTRDAGFFRARGGDAASIQAELSDTKINCLLPDGNYGLWVGTDKGVAHWDGSKFTSAGLPKKLSAFQALAMIHDRDGNLWVGTDSQGLLRINGNGVATLDDPGGNPEAVTAIFEDREGNLWTGSSDGLDRLRDAAFVSYSQPEGLPTNGSNPIYVDEENRMWFPPVSGGLWWVKNGQHGTIHQAGLDRDVVYSIDGREGELWLGRQRGGLTRLSWTSGPSGETFTTKTYTHADGLAQDSVYSVYEARDGSVWAGTLSGGANRLKDGKFTSYTIDQGLASNTVASILQTLDGTVWFATPNGLSALTEDRWISYAPRDGLPSDNINCLFEDSGGVLWVGTSAGLAFRTSRQFQGIAAVPDKLRAQILGIAEDPYGSLWIATSDRVLRIDRVKLMQGFLTEGDIREFTLADGLRGLEGVKRHRSVVADRLGRIWFSLNRGMSVVDPTRLNRSEIPVITHIQSMSADNVVMKPDSRIRVPPGRQRVIFDFVGLNLSVPEGVRYRFKLDGFDRAWNGPVERREAIYTNLSPGTYRFHVMSSDALGLGNGNDATLDFEIAPEFWQTWWFRVCAVLAAGLLFLAFYRLRLRQLTHQLNVRFDERLGERTRIAQELHDTLLQGFLSALMQLHAAVDRLPDESPSRSPLNRVLELMTQVIDEGRNAVRGLRSQERESTSLEQAFARIQREFAAEFDISFRVIVQGESRALHPMLHDEVYRIGREALVNALRHSGARSIEVELEYASNHLRMVVRDDGRGIDPHTLQAGKDGHWGLAGMRERAEKIGAKLRLWSRPAAGTEVELSVPAHLAFRSHSRTRTPKWISRLYFSDSAAARAASKTDDGRTTGKTK